MLQVNLAILLIIFASGVLSATPVVNCDNVSAKDAIEALVAVLDVSKLSASDWFLNVPANPCDGSEPSNWQEKVVCTSGEVTGIELVDKGVSALPAELGCLSSLVTLKFSNNAISHVPDSLGMLSGLKTLDIGHNMLTELPGSFSTLTSLVTLDISGNKYSVLPEVVLCLSALETLYIKENEIASLPAALGDMSALGTLHAGFNKLIDIPGALISSSIHTLKLENNQIASLPSLSSPHLGEVNVKNNALSTLPCIDTLTNLSSIDVSNNLLTEVPDCLGTSASHFELSYNKLSQLPPSYALLPIKYHYLSYNEFSVFPEVVCSMSTSLSVTIMNNKLEEIPACVSTMNTLERLYVQHNLLTKVPDVLPASLQDFYASYNMLTSVPSMKGLRYLFVDHNEVVDMSGACASEVKMSLDMQYNPLATIDSCIEGKDVEMLYLQHTQIENVDFLPTMPTLHMIDLTGTKITYLPPATPSATFRQLIVDETCVDEIPAAYLTPELWQKDAYCTYVPETPEVGTSRYLGKCPWLHCENARQYPSIIPSEEEISFNEFGPCRAGYECSGIGPGTPCPEGKYSLGGASECSDVPVFYYTPATRDELLICPPGHTCAGGSASPDPCPENTYKAVEGEGECLDCDDGLHSPAGSSQCGVCVMAGVYHDGYVCRTCERGLKCHGDDSKVACGAGEYNDVTGASACKPCPANSVPSADHTTCEAPPAGYTEHGGIPVPCDGVVVNNECKPCPYDHVCADGVATPYVADCTGTTLESVALDFVTSMGIVTDTSNSDPCNWAGSGLFCIGSLLSEGFTVDLTSIPVSGTLPLNLGCFGTSIKELQLSDSVGPITGGFPRSMSMLSALTRIVAFDLQLGGVLPDLDGLGALEYMNVGKNYFVGEVASLPGSLKTLTMRHNCFRGEPSSLLDLTSLTFFSGHCLRFTEGAEFSYETWVELNPRLVGPDLYPGDLNNCGMPRCNTCLPGEKTTAVPFTCAECEAGHFCVDGVQTICPPGTWSAAGAASCTRCALGTYSSEAGRTTECIDVPTTGQVVNPVDPTEPLVCGAGTYSKVDRTGCDECLPGSSCPGGDIKPVLCAKGSYQDAGAQGLCLSVGAGQYQDKEGQTGGVDVPAGSYTDTNTRDVLNACPKGYKCAGGDDQPVKCDGAGEYQDETGHSTCKTVPAGSYTNLTTRDVLTPCEAGYKCAGLDAQPKACVTDGTYAPEGASECLPCDEFRQITGPSHDKCDTLTGDQFADADHLYAVTCGAGSYMDAGYCKLCPKAHSCPGDGLTILCDGVGEYQDAEGQDECELVPAGHYVDLDTRTKATPCPQNFECTGGDDQPAPCTGTSFAPEGSESCSVCNHLSGTSYCEFDFVNGMPTYVLGTCPSDSYITDASRTECIVCESGYTCDGTTKHDKKTSSFGTALGASAGAVSVLGGGATWFLAKNGKLPKWKWKSKSKVAPQRYELNIYHNP